MTTHDIIGLSNGTSFEIISSSSHTGYSSSVFGNLVIALIPSVKEWREKSGLDIERIVCGTSSSFSASYFTDMLVFVRDNPTPLKAHIRFSRFRFSVFAKPRFSGVDLAMYLNKEGRPPVMGEDIKQGSVIRKDGVVVYIDCPFGGGKQIQPDGTLNGHIHNPQLRGIISGYAVVNNTVGFEVIHKGSTETFFSSSMCN